jgi:general secretion pathway protein D
MIAQQRTTIIQTPFGPKEIPVEPTQQTPQQTPQQAPPVATPVLPNAQQNPGNAAAQPAPQAQANPGQDDQGVQLRIAGQDIRQVIQIIADALKINYVIDPGIKGTVDIFTNETLRRSDLLPILESILKINNATMIKTGNFYQIVPAAGAARQPIEIIDQQSRLAPDDQFVTQIIRMKFVAATEMAKILTPFLGEAGASLTVHETGNIILLTDRRSNVRKLLGLVDEFDSTAFQDQGIRLIQIKSNQARAIVDDLKTVFSGYGLSDKSAIRFIVIDRLNSILAVTPNPAVFPEIERWITTLDQPVVLSGIQTFVYHVKNAKAIDLQKVLSELYNQDYRGVGGSAFPNAAISNPPIANPSIANPLPATPQLPQGSPVVQPPQQVQGTPVPLPTAPTPIRIIADEVTNSLVIQATPQQYADVKRTLDQLDILRRQVLIDAQVYEVVLDQSSSLGISALLQNRDTSVVRQTTGSFATPPNGGPAALSLNTFAFIGRMRELLLFLNAQENRSRVRTLSAPSVMVTDNGVAQFQVGTEVPIPTSSSVTPVQSGGTNLFAQTIQFRNTGVILQVRPQINESGNVTLDVQQEVSQAGTNTVSAIVAPVIGKSSVTSQIVVEDGQTIAIGGFIRETNDLTQNRVPVVGRLPGVGLLLGNTTKSKTRSELIVVITPHVLRTHNDADLASDELKSKLKEIKGLLK